MSRLRRLVQWKYALRETALIVVGVLIALAVNAWWSQRVDRSRERSYLRQLLADATSNERILASAIAEDSVSLAALVLLSTSLRTGQSIQTPATDLFDVALRYSDPRPVLGTLGHLIQTGAIELIRADTLRLAILEYTSLMEADLAEANRHVDLLLTAMRSWVIRQQAAGFDCALFLATSESERSACNQTFVAAWPSLRRDAEYRAAVHNVRVATWNRLFYLRRMLEQTHQFRKNLEVRV